MDEGDRLDDHGGDATLVGAVHRGDVLAFDALYRRHVPAVAMIAREQVRDPDRVAEAIQETFRARRRLKARVLMDVLARRHGQPCSELAALPAPDLLAIARHLDTCDTCAQAARTVLV